MFVSTCAYEINRYLKSIAVNLVITCDEIIGTVVKSYYYQTKTTPVNFDEKRMPVKLEISIFICPFDD